jgi:hypothetical protein
VDLLVLPVQVVQADHQVLPVQVVQAGHLDLVVQVDQQELQVLDLIQLLIHLIIEL